MVRSLGRVARVDDVVSLIGPDRVAARARVEGVRGLAGIELIVAHPALGLHGDIAPAPIVGRDPRPAQLVVTVTEGEPEDDLSAPVGACGAVASRRPRAGQQAGRRDARRATARAAGASGERGMQVGHLVAQRVALLARRNDRGDVVLARGPLIEEGRPLPRRDGRKRLLDHAHRRRARRGRQQAGGEHSGEAGANRLHACMNTRAGRSARVTACCDCDRGCRERGPSDRSASAARCAPDAPGDRGCTPR